MSDQPDRHYARIYHRFKREYAAVYKDDRSLAAWVRLLMEADASWPTRPPLPRWIRGTILADLVDTGLVILDGTDYTVRGLDADRMRMRNAGRAGAAVRWESDRTSDGNAIASAVAMPTRPDHTRPETTPPPTKGKRENGTNPRALGTNPRANGTSPRQEREGQKRAPTSLHEILKRAAAAADE